MGPSSVALNTIGQLMENIIVQERLLVLNHSDSPPTFRGDNGQVSWIDITAVTPNLLSRIVSWSVDESMEVGSDHIPIHIVLFLCTPKGGGQKCSKLENDRLEIIQCSSPS